MLGVRVVTWGEGGQSQRRTLSGCARGLCAQNTQLTKVSAQACRLVFFLACSVPTLVFDPCSRELPVATLSSI